MPHLHLASNNAHKAEELRAMLAGTPWRSVSLAKDLAPGITWDEGADTFIGNARIKAMALRSRTPGAHAYILADDSGLEVEALGGAPGVHSSRYAGREGDDAGNNAKLLTAMVAVPAAQRSARFVCTLLLVDPDGGEHVFTGECKGSIATAARGRAGFGYDPLFIVSGMGGRTLAELSAEEKNSLSHRRQALDGLLAWLNSTGAAHRR